MVFKHLLCVSDLSLVSQNAEYAAVKLAHHFNSQLTVLSCGENYSHVPNNYFDENVIQPVNDVLHNTNYEKYLEQKKKETMDHFDEVQKQLNLDLNKNILYEIKLENEVTATLDLLEENKFKYDLIIVGKQENTHWERFLFGSPGKEICDETKLPTLLIPSGDKWKSWEPTGVLVCTSLKSPKEDSKLLGAYIAKKFNVNLTIMHVINENSLQFTNNFSHIFPIDYIPPQNALQTVDELITQRKGDMENIIQDLKETVGLQQISGLVGTGLVVEKVMDHIKSFPKNNLLIIGSKGENALKRFFLGSNTDVIEEACRIPILIVFYPNL